MRFARILTAAVTAGLLGLPVLALTASPVQAAGTYATRVSMTRTPPAQLYGGQIRVDATLEAYSEVNMVWMPINDGEVLLLERRLAGKTAWVQIDEATEDPGGQGHVTFTTTAVQNASYRVRYAGGTFEDDPEEIFTPSVSAVQGVKVARDLGAQRKQVNGPKFKYYGKVRPTYAKKKVVLQKKLGAGRWKTVDSTTTSRRSAWSFTVFALRKKGKVSFRAFTPSDRKFIKSYARTFIITTY